jgi:fluoroquinolone transport system ATP-binding protein
MAQQTAVDVRDLTFAYAPRGRHAVDGMTFRIAPGEIFGFLGPSGAGKSTTQRILIGLLRGYGGEVCVLGRNRADWGPEYFERIGVSFELPAHYQKLTARENLRTFAALYRRAGDPDELLARVGLADAADARVATFSKGMQMRLNLVRALLHSPDLLFLDEPTGGLDPAHARSVQELVREQRSRGCTVFLTTHDLSLAEALCDRVAFVVDGRIAQVGTPHDLRAERSGRRVRVEQRCGERRRLREFPLDGLGDDGEFLALLRAGGIESMHTTEPSLEDVFLDVTGRSLG